VYPPEQEETLSVRDRVYGSATAPSEGRQSLLGSLFAISLFLLIVSLSVRQVTAPAHAFPVLESGIGSVTDVNQLVADEAPAVRERAEAGDEPSYVLPGYPLDIAFSRSEILNLDDGELTTLLLQRSAALVYGEGLDAFDRTGEQAFDRFSSQGLVELAVSQVSRTTHDRATLAAVLFALSTALLGALFAIAAHGWTRLRGLGVAAAVGAIPGLLIFGGLNWVLGKLGGSDPFEADLREISTTVFQVPVCNFGIVVLAALVLVAASYLLPLVERRLPQSSQAELPAE